jgi:hypothetical protein
MSTTVRVSTSTRDAVRALAVADGITIDEAIARLARRERQRRMGEALAAPAASSAESEEASPEASQERDWLDLAVDVHKTGDPGVQDARR